MASAAPSAMDDDALQMLVDGLLADTVGRRKVREGGGAMARRAAPAAARAPRAAPG